MDETTKLTDEHGSSQSHSKRDFQKIEATSLASLWKHQAIYQIFLFEDTAGKSISVEVKRYL